MEFFKSDVQALAEKLTLVVQAAPFFKLIEGVP